MEWYSVQELAWTYERADYNESLHAEVSERSKGPATWSVWLEEETMVEEGEAPTADAAKMAAELWLHGHYVEYEWCSGADEA